MSLKHISSTSDEEIDTGLTRYIKDNDIDNLREYILSQIQENQRSLNLVAIAKVNNDTAHLVKELVNTNKIDDSDLSSQIAEEIIADIESQVNLHLAEYQKYTMNSLLADSCNGDESTAKFFNLISLLKDVSVLGRKLLELAPQFNAKRSQSPPSSPRLTRYNSRQLISDEDATSDDLLAAAIESSPSDDFLVLSSSLDSIPVKDMILASLIYIKSHDCFTLSHDFQGVMIVLRRTKFMITNILAPKNQMELITKLLTSIGRYNEMNYVFDLFRDRNQFEILLSKGVERTPELRIALFNYVKKNPEFYALVTLNFSMFREIAESLEASALKRLDKIISDKKKDSERQEGDSSSCCPTSGKVLFSEESLNLSLVELVDASDCFAKADCYKRSNYCEKKAKLIALQLALLASGTKVLDLPQSELNDLIASFQSFEDAYIVAEAYDYHLSWRHALFKNVILRCDAIYLYSYCKNCDLSSGLIEELVLLYRQYLNSQESSKEESLKLGKALRMILYKLIDIELKCKLYSQLNFDDSKKELLQDPSIQAHLKDLKLA